MTAQAEKITDKSGAKTAEKTLEKPTEKPVEKRRALGRGLESLLPGPRAVTAAENPHPNAVSERLHPSKIGLGGAPGRMSGTAEGGVALGTAGESPALQSTAITATLPDLQAGAETTARAPDGFPVVEVPIDEIDHNPYQTRSTFTPAELEDLASSIRVQGVIQPIVVRPATPPLRRGGPYGQGKELQYILILGERRLRASQLASKMTIPAVIRRVSEQQAAEMTLVENLQRQDLNCMDQAKAFRNLSEHFRLTQEEIGKRVGVARETVSNYMRLVRLPGSVQMFLKEGRLTYSHARMLLMIEDDDALERMAEKTVNEKMSVFKLEELITDMQFGAQVLEDDEAGKKPGGARWVDPNVRAQQRSLESVLGMKVLIRDRKGKGAIRIEYGSLDDFDRLIALLKGKQQ